MALQRPPSGVIKAAQGLGPCVKLRMYRYVNKRVLEVHLDKVDARVSTGTLARLWLALG